MTDYSDVDEQVNQVGAAAGSLVVTLPAARKALAAFRTAGYPTSFPVVQDVAALIPVESGVINDWHSRSLDSIPSLYLRLATVSQQYLADTQATFSSGRDVCSD